MILTYTIIILAYIYIFTGTIVETELSLEHKKILVINRLVMGWINKVN